MIFQNRREVPDPAISPIVPAPADPVLPHAVLLLSAPVTDARIFSPPELWPHHLPI